MYTATHVAIPENNTAIDENINMNAHWNLTELKKYRTKLIEIEKEIKDTFDRAYRFIGAAKLIHDDWSMYNKKSLNYSKIFALEEDLKNKILFKYDINSLGKERHLFATAFTSNNIVTFIDNLCEECEKTYVLNGGPGTGKTQVLKFILHEALKRGFFVEVYHDPLIPERVEHIIIPELKTALITSNEINKKRFNGIQIFTENFVNHSLINKNEMDKDKETFYNLLNKGLSIITSTKKLTYSLEKYYTENTSVKGTDKTYDILINKLLEYEKSV